MSNAPDSPPQVPPQIFILDFDATITQDDTISALFRGAVAFHSGRDEETGKVMGEKLKWILTEYAKDWNAFHSSAKVKSDNFKSVGELIKYQQSLETIEQASFDRVSDSRILGGITKDEWNEIAAKAVRSGDVVVRSSFSHFVDEIRSGGGRWGIVSVNFCESWVRGILNATGVPAEEDEVIILANEPDKNGVIHGPHRGELKQQGQVVCTSNGKLEGLKDLTKRLRGNAHGGNQDTNIVFMGDSGTDIECLMAEGVTGIVMIKQNGESKLTDRLEKVGEIEMGRYGGLRSIKSVKDYEQKTDGFKRAWFAKDFEDVLSSPLLMHPGQVT